MSRLKAYMLTEGEATRSKAISEEAAIKLLRGKCLNAAQGYLSGDSTIWRGTKANKYYLTIDTKQMRKKFRSASLIYTLMDEVFKSWKKVPKRNTAVYGSSNWLGAELFGNTTYLLLPYNTSKVAYIQNSDFWYVYNRLISVQEYNRAIIHVMEANGHIYQEGMNARRLVRMLRLLKEKYDTNTYNSTFSGHINREFEEKGDIIDILEKLFPSNVVKIIKPGAPIPNKGWEVWVNGPSLLIHHSKVDIIEGLDL